MDPETIKEAIDKGRINLCCGPVGIHELELILTVLRIRGNVTVENSGSVMSLIELGAYLRSIEAE